MLTTNTPTGRPTRLDYIACYGVYALLLALDVVVLLIWRVTILVLIGALVGPGSVNSAIYDFSMVVLGLGLFGLIIAAEPYLRNGVKQGRLLYRAARVAVPLALFGLLGLLLGMLL
jgi:hypothetical protein